jgi:predicted DNA binding CopG/RHH family protein
LSSTATNLKEEVTLLEEVLEAGKRPAGKKGLGFDNYINEKFKKTIPPKKKSQEQMSN